MIDFYHIDQMNLVAIFFSIILIETVVLIVLLFRRIKVKNYMNKIDELYLMLKEDIKYSITPKFIELSTDVKSLVELTIEIWRFEKKIGKISSKLTENQNKGFENSILKLKTYLNKYDIEILDYTNQIYNEGLNLEILANEKKAKLKFPIIKETIEPTILCKGQVIRKAKIILQSK